MASSYPQKYKMGIPYKLVNYTRETRKGVIASSLEELINTARDRFAVPSDAKITVVLEQDGTEIDDEEYFATLEGNTNLMILLENQKWMTAEFRKSAPYFLVDDTDYSVSNCDIQTDIKKNFCHREIRPLISSLHNDPLKISHLTCTQLEMLSDMDPDSLNDIVYDRLFLTQLKDVSSRYIAEKRQDQESLALLNMFSRISDIEHSTT